MATLTLKPTIHHKTAARATAYGISIQPIKNGWRVTHDPSNRFASGHDLPVLMDSFIKTLHLTPLDTAGFGKLKSAGDETPAPFMSVPSLGSAKVFSVPPVSSSLVSVPPTDEDAPEVSSLNRSVVKKEFKDRYAGLSGTSNGDVLARALSTALLGNESVLSSIAVENGLPFVWQHLNRGMQRMNLANVLRAKLRRKERVVICGEVIPTE